MASKGRERLFKLVTISAGILIGVFIMELVMRVVIFGPGGLSYSRMKSVRSVGVSGLLRPSEHQDILYDLQPDVQALYKLHDFRTNSHGMRDREYDKEKAPGTFRVAVLGDSFTMGSGIAIEDAYHSVLEKRLNERNAGTTWEFINFGVSGYYLSQYTATLRHKIVDWNPDLILIGFCAGNDNNPPPAEKFAGPYQLKPEKNGFFKLQSFSLLGDVWKYQIVGTKSSKLTADELAELQRTQRGYIGANFAEMADILRPGGTRVLVAYLNNAPSEHAIVEETALANGFSFVDATAGFEGKSLAAHSIYLTDKHPNDKANLIFADAIQAALESEGLLAREPDSRPKPDPSGVNGEPAAERDDADA